MRLLPSEREAIQLVAQRWKAQYCTRGQWGTCGADESTEQVYDALRALGPDATRADVAAIIGNDLWVGERCYECGVPAVVLVGAEPDYESATVYLCRECVVELAWMVAP